MKNNNRYLYCAFPFSVKNAKGLCILNGCVAEYAKDVSGYCTDVYMAVNEWLQMHCAGGSHLNYTFRFSILSYQGAYKSANMPV